MGSERSPTSSPAAAYEGAESAGEREPVQSHARSDERAKDGDLVFTNFIDFDQVFGHRRDVAGHADCLEKFDRRLPELIAILRPGDLVILTADHGNDPTYKGNDHTRENIPVMAFGPRIEGRNAGHLRTYADVAQTIAAHLALRRRGSAQSFM